jgi:hypothetical protein
MDSAAVGSKLCRKLWEHLFSAMEGNAIEFAVEVNDAVRTTQNTEIKYGSACRIHLHVGEDLELRISFLECFLERWLAEG